MEKITSSNNNRIVMYAKLNQKKYRDEYGLFLLENFKLIVECIKRGDEIVAVLIDETKLDKFPSIVKSFDEKILLMPSNVFSKISDTVTSQGIIAVMKKPEQTSVSSLGGRILVLDRIQDSGNVGTLMRSALGFGFDGVVLIESADTYSPKVIRSSGGSIFNLKMAETTEKEFLFHVKHTGFAVFSADMDGENLYGIKNFPENMFLIVGNEGQGVSNTIMESSTNSISIPMSKHLESLNAGVSGSIIMSYIASKK